MVNETIRLKSLCLQRMTIHHEGSTNKQETTSIYWEDYLFSLSFLNNVHMVET